MYLIRISTKLPSVLAEALFSLLQSASDNRTFKCAMTISFQRS